MNVEQTLPLPSSPFRLLKNRRRPLALLGLALLGVSVLLIAARRLAHALEYPLDPATLSILGVVVAFSAWAIRTTWFRNTHALTSVRDWAVMLATSLCAMVFGFCLCVTGTSPLGVFLLMLPLVAEESAMWAQWIGRLQHPIPGICDIPPTPEAITVASLLPESGLGDAESPDCVTDLEEEISDHVTQQFTRQQQDGVDELSGILRVPFAAGQRTANAHIAFCPTFAVVPQLDVEPCDGPDVRIKTAQLLPYGVRLELKLDAAADEPTTVLLQFSARVADPVQQGPI